MKRRLTKSESTSSQDKADSFVIINERPVDDISLEFFYKPHNLTLLGVSIAAVIYSAFIRYNKVNILPTVFLK